MSVDPEKVFEKLEADRKNGWLGFKPIDCNSYVTTVSDMVGCSVCFVFFDGTKIHGEMIGEVFEPDKLYKNGKYEKLLRIISGHHLNEC